MIGEIKFFIEAYDNEQYNKDSLAKLFSDTQNIKAIYIPENKYTPNKIVIGGLVPKKGDNYYFHIFLSFFHKDHNKSNTAVQISLYEQNLLIQINVYLF